MIGYPDIEKLLALDSEDPPVLSLYLEVPLDPSGLRELPAGADVLIGAAATRPAGPAGTAGPAGPAGPAAGRVLTQVREEVRHVIDDQARDWPGHGVALFVCPRIGLAEAIVLPPGLDEQAVFAPRPYVRPLLLAVQRHPAYRVAVVDRRHAWLFAVAGDRIDAAAGPTAPGVRSHRYGGWYGLESHRVNERITGLARHHFRDIAGVLDRAIGQGQELLVLGGHAETIPQVLAALPADVRNRFAGSFVADTSALTPGRVRALAGPVVRAWAERSERELATRIQREPPGRLAVTGPAACLDAVRRHAVAILTVPDRGMIPGQACRRCGEPGLTTPGCAHGAGMALPVPDLIEEMAVATLHDGGQVQAVAEPPGGIAALLRSRLGHDGTR